MTGRIERDVVTRKRFYTDPSCDRCKRRMSHVFEQGPEFSDRQFNGGLRVELSGGYGMYYDETSHDLMLCRECGNKLSEFLWGSGVGDDINADTACTGVDCNHPNDIYGSPE